MKTTLLVLLLLVPAVHAQAQQVDSRWTPWLGCWQLLDESVRQPLPAAAAALGPANARQSRRADGVRVCVAPSTTAVGVTLRTTVESQTALEQTIVADGTGVRVTEGECRGSQRAEWSRTGERLFVRADLTCADQASRMVSGLAMIVGGTTWIDIQAIEIGGRENIRVGRYRRADEAPVNGSIAPRLGATRFTVEDVKEAAGKISPRAVEAALIETGASFDLNSRTLLDLDAAGVADSLIDLMVALSYPKQFVVERRANTLGTFATIDDPWDLYSYYYPYGAAFFPYGAIYSYWDRYSPYFYSPFGYAYWAGYGGGYYPASGFVTVDGGQPDSARTGAGRAINGVGYTRILPRETSADGGGGRTRNGTSSSPSGDSSGGNSSSSGSSSSSGGASSSGFSSGSSSGDTGRTAQPR
jgi:hypothetical protein